MSSARFSPLATQALLLLAVGVTAPALASAACSRQVRAFDRAAGPATIDAWRAVAKCAPEEGATRFGAAQRKLDAAEPMAELAFAALDLEVTKPVYGMLEAIGDYGLRESVAAAIGEGCDREPVVEFVRSLHGALKDRDYVTWSPAVARCEAEAVTADLREQASDPPNARFDNKYARVVELYGERRGAEALPLLQEAAVLAASRNGPVASILEAMVKAVTPAGLGAKPEGADSDRLAEALLAVAEELPQEGVGRVADALVSAGREDAAAQLLPKLNPGTQQADGSFLYAVTAVEKCEGKAVIHWAVVEDPSARWSVQDATEAAAKASFKPKLKRCDEPWGVTVASNPFPDAKAAGAWAEEIADTVQADTVKVKSEKRLVLPPAE